MQITAEQVLPAASFATEPALALLPDGAVLLACVEPSALRDGITLYRLRAGEGGWELAAPAQPVPAPGNAGWPELAVLRGAAWLAFLDAGEDGARGAMSLRLRAVEALEVDHLALTATSLRHPRLIAAGDTLALAWVAVEAEEHALYLRLHDPAAPEAARTLCLARSPRRSPLARPELLDLGDGRLLAVWEQQAPARVRLDAATVALGSGGLHRWTLREAPGFLQHPRLALGGGPEGLPWLVYSTDVPEGPPPGLPRWVQACALRPTADGGFAASAPLTLPGMELEAAGEDQSLEFPVITADPSGALVIAARASHNLRLYQLSAAGWAPPLELGPVLWGCRGIRLPLAVLPSGPVLQAAHDRRGITLRVVEGVGGGAPEVPGAAAPEVLAPAPTRLLADAHRGRWASGAEELAAYMGDIHFHSAHSDGVGTLEEALLRARDRYGYDFACLTDHDVFLGRRVTRAGWRAMKDAAQALHAPEEGFATLIGIEYTGPRYPGPGHRCVYLPDADAPLVSRADGLDDPRALLARVRELGGIAIPHHVGWIGGDPEHHDPALQPCWEICSAHGQYECEADDASAPPLGQRPCLEQDRAALSQHYLRRQLEGGARFGFVGGSDGHGLLWHHGMSHRADSHRTGLTGVWAPRLGRAEVLAAVRARRTWATTGEPLVLGFKADGAWMGEVLAQAPRRLEVRVQLTGAGGRLQVFAPVSGRTAVVAAGAAVSGSFDLPALGVHGFLYVRVTQEDGALAWASPVFW